MKKLRCVKIASLVLSLILLCNFAVPTTVTAQTASVTDGTSGEYTQVEGSFTDISSQSAAVYEVESRREENVKHFAMPDGTFRAVAYANAVHTLTEDGTWADIDNRLTLGTKNGLSVYSTENGRTSFVRNITPAGGGAAIFTVEENGYVLAVAIMDGSLSGSLNMSANANAVLASSAAVTNHAERNIEISDDKSAEAQFEKLSTVDNETEIVYTNVISNTDLEYTLTSNNIKENIVVKGLRDSYTYTFGMLVKGLTATQRADGSIVLADEDSGEAIYYIPAPYMIDADGEISYDVSYTLSYANQMYTLTVTADEEWIESPGRAFPVKIDPSISQNATEDTFIDSANPNATNGNNTTLCVSATRVAYIKMPTLPTIPEGKMVTSAELKVAHYFEDLQSVGGITVTAHQVKKSWSASTLTWNIANQYTNLGLDTWVLSVKDLDEPYTDDTDAVDMPEYVSFDVTEAVRAWYAGAPNYGIAFKSYSTVYRPVWINSYEFGEDQPYYYVTYDDPNVEDGTYFFKNVKAAKYMQLDDADEANGFLTVPSKTELWDFSGEDEQRWIVEHVENGYYKITSAVSGLALSVNPYQYNKADKALAQWQYTGANLQLWEFVDLNFVGTKIFKIRPKCQVVCDSEWSMAAQSTTVANGMEVQQKAYTYDNDHGDYWNIEVHSEFDEAIIHTIADTTSDLLMMPVTANNMSEISAVAYHYNNTSSMWRFEHVENNFYKIRNEITGYYLTAPSNNTEGAKVYQSAYNTTYGLWKVLRTVDKCYTIQSKNQYERTTDTPLYLTVSNGYVVQSSDYTNIKWDIKPLVLQLNVLYDQGFIDRYGTSQYANVLNSIYSENSIGNSVTSVFKERFGISVRINISSSTHASYPYEQNCIHKNDIDTYCFDCINETEQSDVAECEAGLHHKNETRMLTTLENTYLYLSNSTNILYTGHRGCYAQEGSHITQKAYGWGNTNGNRILVLSALFEEDIENNDYFDGVIRTTIHEILHNFGVPHCDKSVPCMMSLNNSTINANLTMCDICLGVVESNKLRIWGHN